MTEFDPENYHDDDELDLEVPLDGRDGQPPEEGSSDEPETLDAHDPLRQHEPILVEGDSPSTVIGEAVAATEDEAIDTERVIDDDTDPEDGVDESQ